MYLNMKMNRIHPEMILILLNIPYNINFYCLIMLWAYIYILFYYYIKFINPFTFVVLQHHQIQLFHPHLIYYSMYIDIHLMYSFRLVLSMIYLHEVPTLNCIELFKSITFFIYPYFSKYLFLSYKNDYNQ